MAIKIKISVIVLPRLINSVFQIGKIKCSKNGYI